MRCAPLHMMGLLIAVLQTSQTVSYFTSECTSIS
jgi:hypothetical protein